MTREEMLLMFEKYTDNQLERLLAIGDSILTPLDGELTSVDFGGMVNQVFKVGGLADQYFPEWTDRSKSDFGRFLVELFALFSDKDFFYINHFFRESFAGTAEMYRSLVQMGLEQGYAAPANLSASGTVQLIFAAGAQETVARGAVEIGNSILPGQFYTNDEFVAPLSGVDVAVNVTFRHGRILKTDGYFDGNSIFVNITGISKNSIKLVLQNEEWDEVLTFKDGTNVTKHYRVFYDSEGRAEIVFASEGFGAKPTKGQFYEVEVLQGGGYIGDVLANNLDTVYKADTVRTLNTFVQSDILGGTSQLPLEVLRETIIGRNRTQDRIVNPDDAQYFCNGFDFVKKVYAEAFSYYLYVYVLPVTGLNLSPTQITQIHDALEPKLLMGYNLTVADPLYVPVTLSITVYLLPQYNKQGAQIIAQKVVEDYLNPLKNGQFGEGVKRSKLTNYLLQSISGAQNVTYDVLHRSGFPDSPQDLIFLGSEVVDYPNSTITINIQGGL